MMDVQERPVPLLQRIQPYPKALGQVTLGYTESQGHPRLREAIAATYDSVDPDDIVFLTFYSAFALIQLFFLFIILKGEHSPQFTKCSPGAGTNEAILDEFHHKSHKTHHSNMRGSLVLRWDENIVD